MRLVFVNVSLNNPHERAPCENETMMILSITMTSNYLGLFSEEEKTRFQGLLYLTVFLFLISKI